jgi:hypothetical protein
VVGGTLGFGLAAAGVVGGGAAGGAVVAETAATGTTIATAACADGDCTNEVNAAVQAVRGVANAACADGDCTNEARAAGQAVQQATQAIQSPTGQRTILWLEEQANRVGHIMDSKHAWDRLINPSGNLLDDYRAVQPYIQQAINSGTGTPLPASSPLGTVMQYVATINGQQVVVQAVQLANGTIQVTNAWVQTQ